MLFHLVVVVLAFSLHVRIGGGGEGLTIHSLPVLGFFVFVLDGDQFAHTNSNL